MAERKASDEAFTHLRNLPKQKPKTKAGQIRWLWPDIKQALATGHTVKEVFEALTKDGFKISYSKLRLYVAQLRREYPAVEMESETAGAVALAAEGSPEPPPGDPTAAIRQRRARKRFDHDPFSTRKKDLI